jgi:hypothetical protein
MGQFSWCCALCDQEVMHGQQPGYQWATDAVILWPNGDRRSGRYEDGYGDIAGVNLVDQRGGWRLVHQRCYDKVRHLGTEELFASFHPDRHASDQGWWPGERVAVKRYGEPEMSELTKENRYVCYERKRTWKAKWAGGVCPFGCVRPKNYLDSAETIEKGWGDSHEMVEPVRYLDYDLGNADGVIVCQNDQEKRTNWERYHEMRREGTLDEDNPPTEIKPCFYFGEPQQARITKPQEYRRGASEFSVRCRGCKSENVEVLQLTSDEAN